MRILPISVGAGEKSLRTLGVEVSSAPIAVAGTSHDVYVSSIGKDRRLGQLRRARARKGGFASGPSATGGGGGGGTVQTRAMAGAGGARVHRKGKIQGP